MPLHKDLTGADLHEPKGVESATSGTVYVADGSGSGTWGSLLSDKLLTKEVLTSSGGNITIPQNTTLSQALKIILDSVDPEEPAPLTVTV